MEETKPDWVRGGEFRHIALFGVAFLAPHRAIPQFNP
jgi:hypothetical protein